MRTTHLDWRKFGHNELVKLDQRSTMFRYGFNWELRIQKGCLEYDQLRKLAEDFFGESFNVDWKWVWDSKKRNLKTLSWCYYIPYNYSNKRVNNNVLYFKQREDLDRVISCHALFCKGETV